MPSSSSHHHHKHHSHKHHRSHKNKEDRHKSSRSKLVKQALKVLESKGRSRVSPRLKESDYEARKADFRVWLARCKGLKMDGMKPEDLHTLFERFSKLWNHSKLDEDIYDGTAARRAESSVTVLKLKSQAVTNDTNILTSLRDGVAERSSDRKKEYGAQKTPSLTPAEEEERREEEVRRRKTLARKRREDNELVLDQIAPAETGRDALIAKRINAREERRAREDSPDADIYGCDVQSSESYEASLKRKRAAKEASAAKVAAERNEMYQEFQRKEAEKIAMFQQMAQQYGFKIRDRDPPPS